MAVALACCAAGDLRAASMTVPTDVGSGITVELEQPLSQTPPSGLYPFLVKIHNATADVGDWSVNTSGYYGGGVSTQTPITVEPGKSASVWIYAPVATQGMGGGSYRQLQIIVRGTKIPGGSWTTVISHSGSFSAKSMDVHFPGFSAQVARKGETALQEQFKKDFGGTELDSTRVDLDGDLSDWRAYSGLGQLWLTDDEWSGMGGASKAALMEWLALGGRLVVLSRDVSEQRLSTLKIPPEGAAGQRRVGAGRISLLRWDGVIFPTDQALAQLVRHDDGDPMAKLSFKYHDAWKLPEIVGVFSVHSWLIFGFIVVFGVLVGPVNLFVFAGGRHRHRLFWTTPLISLAGSALLVVIMIFQDGIGGTGARRILAIMAPAQKKTALIQEQVSRTGVLLGSTFSIPEPVWIGQIALTNPGSFNPMANQVRQVSESGDKRSGEWFASRSVQAQLTQTVRPSRGGVEFYPSAEAAGSPSVISSLAAPLREVFIVDEKGRVWKAQDLPAGVKKAMSASSQNEMDAWFQEEVSSEFGPVAKDRLEHLRKEREHAFAISEEADSLAVPTLKSIRWKDQKVIFAGPYEKR